MSKLNQLGVTLLTLQRCRDVICDLSDFIGMELVLYEPPASEYAHFSMLSTEQIALCRREWLICWLLSFEEKLSWLPLSTLPDPSIIEHAKAWKNETSKYQSAAHEQFKERLGLSARNESESSPQQTTGRHLFAKPRVFSSVFQSKLLLQFNQNEKMKMFEIPQDFLNECIFHAANSSFYCKNCPIDIRSRVIGYFVNALNDRMAMYNYHNVASMNQWLRSFASKLFSDTSNDEEKEESITGLIDNIQIMQSVFVMFPDFIPISFIRHLIALSTKYRLKITILTTENEEEETDALPTEQIIKYLRILYELLRPIHGIALNITNEYQTPSYADDTASNYPKSSIWVKHREYLVGALFELFLYLNGSFEWFLQKIESKQSENENVMIPTDFNNDVFFWFSSSLTLISHSLIGMNSEGEQDVFFELDWSSLIFVSNFVMDHILHQRTEFSLCLHSYLSEFYQFLLIGSKPNEQSLNATNNHNLAILNNIDEEYRYNMMTIWHCMAVLRQIALRSTDLSGRKNLKTKKNKSFIFESLELLTEILGNEIWRNLMSSEALASPFHKLALKEFEVEELVYMHCVNTSNLQQSQSQIPSMNFSVHSGLMSNSLSAISEQNELKSQHENETESSYVNIPNRSQIHVILDSLYHSINHLLNHPVVMSGTNNLSLSPSPNVSGGGSMSPSTKSPSININKSLCSILQTWHYQLFDALGSSHHQIVASAFRILSISTRFHVLKNIQLFTKKEEKNKNKSITLTPNTSMIDIAEDAEIDSIKVYNSEKDNIPTLDSPHLDLSDISDDDDYEDTLSNSDAMSVASTSVSFSMSYHYTKGAANFGKISKRQKHLNDHITKKDRIKFQRIHSLINSIIPTMYLLPHNTRSYVPWHELRSWFLSWYLFMNMVEESPLEFKLQIVQTMKHDHKYTSPLGSYSLALREIIEHIYISQSLSVSMNQFVSKIAAINSKHLATTKMFEFAFDLGDFCTNYPNDDPNISANLLSRCRWLQQMTGNVFNKNIFFSNLAIRVYDRLLTSFPALCRYWASNDIKDRVTRNIVSKITSSEFSPIILKNIFNAKKLNRNLKDLRKNNYNNSSFRLDDDVVLKLKCNSQSREIEALYICDEVQISMIALYPYDYPLKAVEFAWKETCGLPPKKVKNWQMLLRGMVNNQNAQITEAFMLLSINIYQHYKGIDECPICYSVVHPTKKTLPKVKCGTCKGKFHRYCIYKWTKTSQKSTCPLCRSLI